MNRNEYAKDPKTWFGLNRPDMDVNDADAVVFGIPFEGGVSYRAGTAEAPDTLRANTTHATPCSEQLAFFKDFDVVDAGNAEGGRDEMFADVQALTAELVRKGRRFTMVGGDHSVTIPVERGINDALDEPFGIIHIDAHMDLSYDIDGDVLSHGSVEQRATELSNVGSADNIFFIGIRSIEEDEFGYFMEHDIHVRTAYDCYHDGIEKVAEDCIECMRRFDKVYLTFDIDALDPAYAGGTGTPQFGGLTSRMALTLLEKLFTQLNIIGFDVVEVAPALDDSWASLYAARKIISEGWSYWADRIGKLVKKA